MNNSLRTKTNLETKQFSYQTSEVNKNWIDKLPIKKKIELLLILWFLNWKNPKKEKKRKRHC